MVEERWRKEKAKKKKGDKESGGAKIRPPHLSSAKLLSQLGQIELTQSTPKKKFPFLSKK